MSIPFTTAQDYLQTEALSVISLNTVINLADTPDQDDVFFETNHKALTKKSIYGVSPAQRIRYYPILNKVSNIVARNLQYLNNARNSPNQDYQLYVKRLLRCLVCETDVLRICKDMKIVKITPIFLHILDYAYSFDHMVTLYMNASLHFRRMDIHLDDVEQHSLIIYYTVPFMKLFEAYDYDAALMYYWNNSQPEQRMVRKNQEMSSPMMKYIREEKFKGKGTLQEDLVDKVLEIYSNSRIIMDYFREKTLHTEETIVPKFIADDLIALHNLPFKPGSHQYCTFIAEIVIVHYVISNKLEELIVILTAIQSFFGNFYLSYKVFNKNQKQLGFLVYELLNEFQPLPGHFIIDVIRDYFERIIACKCSKEQGKLMKNLDILLSSVSFALNLVTHLPPEKNKTRYNSIVNRLFLVKTDMKINPEASMNDVGPFYTDEPLMPIFDLTCESSQEKSKLLFKDEKEDLNNPEMLTLLEMSLMLQKSMRRTFDDPEEIKIFTMHDKYANDEYYPHNIFENLLQILFGVGEELKAKGEHSIFEISGIWAGYRLIEKVLDDYFKNEMADSSIDLVGSQYMTCRELDICLWWVWSMKDRFEDHFFDFLLLCFKKLESFITLSLEPEFLDRVRKSSNPKALVKKHVCFLKFLNKNSTVVLKTSEQYNPVYIQKLQDVISDSKLLDFLFTKLEVLPKDKITQALFTSCVEETINIIVASQCRHLEGYQSSLELIETMKKLDTLMVNHTTKYKFCDLACVIFQILFSNRLIHQAYRIIPATLHKTFFEIMSDLENYNRQRSTSCLTFMFHPIFITVDFSNYTNDPQGLNVAIQCIVGLLQKLSEAINHLNAGFITFDFNKPRLYDQNLINESIIARLYSRMLRYAKIFHQMLPYFGNLVNYFAYRKQEAELQNLSQIANSIIMNPLLQMVSPANLNAIFSIMKDIYAINSSAFLITTTNMIFARFLHACHSLGETLKKIARTKDNAKAISCLKSLLEIRENFWLSLSTQHVELFECLGQEAVFSVFTFHLTNHFLEKYLVNLSVSKDTLHTLALNYEKLLNVNLDLILLYNLQTPGEQSAQDLLTNVDLSGQNNLYTKLILKNITPLLIMTQPENTNFVLENFLVSNLNTERLLPYQPERGLSVLYHQLCAFGVVLNIFIEGHAFFEAFVIQNKLLTPTLTWIYDVMVQYKDIIGGTVKCIPALDKIISKFISLINLT